MAYTTFTQLGFTTELAQALSDPSHVHWSQDELNRALNEALLLWGALTSYWTTRATFSTSPGVPFYDLSTSLSTLRTRNLTLGDLTKEIQYHLYEPANGVSGSGMTDQFTVGSITSALARHRNQWVLDTRIPMTFTTVAGGSVVTLDQFTSLIARAAWIDTATGIVTPLRRTDSFAAQSYSPTWPTVPGKRPYGYSQIEAMPLQMVVIPPPLNSGFIHLLFTQSKVFAVADNTPMGVPDEFAWAIKYAAMNEILATNSQGYDPLRAKYITERYSAALELALLRHSIMQVRNGSTPLPLVQLDELDSGKPYWQTIQGAPQVAACAYDILALYRVPDASYTMTCDVSQAAPLPTSSGSYLQLGAEECSYLMDYCRHILCLKLGGTEFVQTMPLYDNFLKGAAQRTKLIGFKARYLTPLFDRAAQEDAA